MKKCKYYKGLSVLLCFLMLLPLVPTFSFSTGNDVEINETNFPDPAFADLLRSLPEGEDGVFTESEIQGIREMECYGEIRSLEGLGFFTALETLYCFNTKIVSLDLSQNAALKMVNLQGNPLKILNVSGNTALETLEVKGTELSELDVKNNRALKTLDCHFTDLTSIDVQNNPELVYLNLDDTLISQIDLSGNPKLQKLYVSSTLISTLDLSHNPELTELFCTYTNIKNLDLTYNTKLMNLSCSDNPMYVLNLDHQENIGGFTCINNHYSIPDGALLSEYLPSLDLSRVHTAYKEGTSAKPIQGGYFKDGRAYFDEGSTEIEFSYGCKKGDMINKIGLFYLEKEGNHDFSLWWRKDQQNHYRQCRCGEQSEIAPHAFEEWTVILEPTSYAMGLKTRKCTVCDFEESEALPINPLAGMSDISKGKEGFLYSRGSAAGTEFTLTPCEGLTDGKPNDNWTYGPFGEMYALIDLGAVYEVGAVHVQTYPDLKHGWSVYVSKDNQTFEKVKTVETVVHKAEGVLATFPKASGRYVKIVPDFYVTDAHFDFKEITVYGSVGVVPLENVAKNALFKMPDGTALDTMNNGDKTDFTEITGVYGGSVTLDLGENNVIKKVEAVTADKKGEYFILGSTYGDDWKLIGMKEKTNITNTFTVTLDGYYRYIRLQATGIRENGDYATGVSALRAYGTEGEIKGTITAQRSVDSAGYHFLKKVENYFVTEFKEPTEIRKLALHVPDGTYGVYVEYSPDGVEYKPLCVQPATRFGYNTETGYELFPMEGLVVAKSLRISCIGSETETLQLSELEIFSPKEEVAAPKEDIDGDGNTNISDVTALLNALSTASGSENLKMDLNEDGIVNISDVTALLNFLSKM